MKIRKNISTVSFIGSGNVATALALALYGCGVKVVEVFSPNVTNSKQLATKVGANYVADVKELNTVSDIYIIAIPDKYISDVVGKLRRVQSIIVHTSGSVPLSIFSKNTGNYGVFYPLQTFTKNKITDITNVPVCIEGSDKQTTDALVQLANRISNKVVLLSSEQRQYLHLAAVTVNNFTNFMYIIANELLSDKDIDFALLYPLIIETATKINNVDPEDAQTGPARRHDMLTINNHIEMLSKQPGLKKIYGLLSNQIIKKFHD